MLLFSMIFFLLIGFTDLTENKTQGKILNCIKKILIRTMEGLELVKVCPVENLKNFSDYYNHKKNKSKVNLYKIRKI